MTELRANLDTFSPMGQVFGASDRSLTELQTGTVTAVSATTLNVNIRGVTIKAAYLASYSAVVGDLVAIARQDATHLVLGRLAGVGTNAVLNPSFEQDGAISGVPTSWNFSTLSGAPTVSVLQTGFAPDGLFELAVSAGAASQDSYVYSNPIAVSPGQQWAVSAFASAVYPSGAPQNATASLYGLWFADDTNLYPTTSSADTLIAQALNLSQAPVHASVSGNVTVPAGAAFMRVGLRSVSVAQIVMLWDLVTARRIG